jgi:hypothetical protein
LTREAVAATVLREVRRGEAADEIELVDSQGNVVIVVAYGLHPDERARVREIALRLMQSAAYEPGRP